MDAWVMVSSAVNGIVFAHFWCRHASFNWSCVEPRVNIAFTGHCSSYIITEIPDDWMHYGWNLKYWVLDTACVWKQLHQLQIMSSLESLLRLPTGQIFTLRYSCPMLFTSVWGQSSIIYQFANYNLTGYSGTLCLNVKSVKKCVRLDAKGKSVKN